MSEQVTDTCSSTTLGREARVSLRRDQLHAPVQSHNRSKECASPSQEEEGGPQALRYDGGLGCVTRAAVVSTQSAHRAGW